METGSGVFTGVLLVCFDIALAGGGMVVGCAGTDDSFIISSCCPISCHRGFSLVDGSST